MINYEEIVISVKIKYCRRFKRQILNICSIDINQLSEDDKIEMYLIDAQEIGIVAKKLK